MNKAGVSFFFQLKKRGSGAYRYGFNGKEKDDEVKNKEGSQLDYGMRIYDTRLGRFLSVDPITIKYPELTPYQFASNRPIDGIDMDGLEYIRSIPKFNNSGNRTFSDYVSAIDNGVIDVLNTVPTLWNSGVSTVQSIRRGSYGEDVKRDFKQLGSSLKQTGTQVLNQPLKTLTSPEALEVIVSAYVGAKALPGGGNKGNLLKPVTASPSVVESSVAANKIVAQGINGAKFTGGQIAKMLTPSEGDMMTIYRGMTGTEANNGALFLTTSEKYAATYSSNVKSFTISRTGYKRLVNEGLIEQWQGTNSTAKAAGALEIKIPNQTIKKAVLNSTNE